MKKILNILAESFLKGFSWGLKLTRPKTVKNPIISDSHTFLAKSIFDSTCMSLTEIGKIMPIIFLVKDNSFMPLFLDPESMKQLNVESYTSMAIKVADQQNADAMIFVSEQLQIRRELSDEEIKKFEEGKLLPSLDPNKQEVLCLIYITSKGKMTSLIGDIQRGPDNTPFVRDSEWDEPKTNTELFQPWR